MLVRDHKTILSFSHLNCISSAQDRGTVYYYRNLLNARDVVGKVKNAYRPHKMRHTTPFWMQRVFSRSLKN